LGGILGTTTDIRPTAKPIPSQSKAWQRFGGVHVVLGSMDLQVAFLQKRSMWYNLFISPLLASAKGCEAVRKGGFCVYGGLVENKYLR